MTTFTASEVRELVGTEDIIARARVDKMLHAYADRLEADNKVQAQPQSGEWVMAPREPTNTMMIAASRMAFAANMSVSLNFICAIYQTMLAVAPQPRAAEPVAWMHPELHRGHPYPEECLTTEAIDGWLPLYAHSAQAQDQPPDDQFDPERNAHPGDLDKLRIERGGAATKYEAAQAQPPAASVQDKKDAARYRWMRRMRNRERAADMMKYKMNLDAAIDAAMAEESGNG